MSGSFVVSAPDLSSALTVAKVTASKDKTSVHRSVYLSLTDNKDATGSADVEPEGLSDEFLAHAADDIPDDIDAEDDGTEIDSQQVLNALGYADGLFAGVSSVAASGNLEDGLVIPVDSVSTVVSFLKEITASADEEVDIQVESYSDTMTFTPLVGGQKTLKLLGLPTDDYEIDLARAMLSGEQSSDTVQDFEGEKDLPDGKRLTFGKDIVKLLGQIAGATGNISLYPVAHPCSVILIDADNYRGAFVADRYAADADVNFPDSSLHL